MGHLQCTKYFDKTNTPIHCNPLQHTATIPHWPWNNPPGNLLLYKTSQYDIHCSTLRYNATHSNILQHTAKIWLSLSCALALSLSLSLSHVQNILWLSQFKTTMLATLCNTLQHSATHCSTLHHTRTRTIFLMCGTVRDEMFVTLAIQNNNQIMFATCIQKKNSSFSFFHNFLRNLILFATHCNTALCNTLQHAATHCNTALYNTLQHAATRCSTL